MVADIKVVSVIQIMYGMVRIAFAIVGLSTYVADLTSLAQMGRAVMVSTPAVIVRVGMSGKTACANRR